MDNVGGNPDPNPDHHSGHGRDIHVAPNLLLPHNHLGDPAQHGQWCLPEHCIWFSCKTARQIHRRSCIRIGKAKFFRTNQCTNEYSNIFEYFPPNIDFCIRFVAIFKAEYYSNIRIYLYEYFRIIGL